MSLACYAASAESSLGRLYDDDNPSLRDEFQRDRDRVVHSSAFRRLEYKTQVFVNHEGDMFRTRLTHSLEVSQIARTVSRSLKLNEDLTEAISLAHDLGHTPFGHAGQDVLNDCMNKHGGFEHNLQSLRVVDLLEEKYADFPGLNLSFETREGILKHCSRNNARKLGELGERFLNGTHPSLEAQIANIADEIAYGNHDVDDGVRSGLITIEQLCDCTLFKESHDQVLKQYGTLDQSRQINEIKRRMINLMVENLVENSQRLIDAAGVKSINDVRTANSQLISLTDAMREYHIEMKQFLRNNLYHHEHVKKMTDNAKVVIRSLFESYSNNPENLPEQLNSSSTNTELFRHISDYIAGMTDRFAISEYKRITQDDFDIYEL